MGRMTYQLPEHTRRYYRYASRTAWKREVRREKYLEKVTPLQVGRVPSDL